MAFKRGFILLWSGAIVDIPYGWIICDGTHGTPDLRDQFVIGAGSTYNPNDTGGSQTHNHALVSDIHSHTVAGGTGIADGMDYSDNTSSEIVTGVTDASNHMPPWYALCYIMKQ